MYFSEDTDGIVSSTRTQQRKASPTFDRVNPIQMNNIKCIVFLLLSSVHIKAQLDLPPYEDYGDVQRPDVQKTDNGPYQGDIKRLLQALDVQASQQCTNNVAAQWNFETNVNEHTQLEAVSWFIFL